jgi:hypothetical protein
VLWARAARRAHRSDDRAAGGVGRGLSPPRAQAADEAGFLGLPRGRCREMGVRRGLLVPSTSLWPAGMHVHTPRPRLTSWLSIDRVLTTGLSISQGEITHAPAASAGRGAEAIDSLEGVGCQNRLGTPGCRKICPTSRTAGQQ